MANDAHGALLQQFVLAAPPSDYRVYLAEQFEPGGLLPDELRGEHVGYLQAFLSNHPSQYWWSKAFYMPSLSWRSELLSAPVPVLSNSGAAKSSSPLTRLGAGRRRWSVAFLLFERDGADPRFDQWAQGLDRATRACRPPLSDPSGPSRGANSREFWGGAHPCQTGRPGRPLGIVQLDPSLAFVKPDEPLRFTAASVVEVHLNLPAYARRGHWHIVQNIAGPQYGVTPFSGISLFFQRGARFDCGFVAVQSALMITAQRLGGRPLGTTEIIGNAVRALLQLPSLDEMQLTDDERLGFGRCFQSWMEARENDPTLAQSPDLDRYEDFLRDELAEFSDAHELTGEDRLETRYEKGTLHLPTILELIVLALRMRSSETGEGSRGCGPSASGPTAADFNCSAVTEFLKCPIEIDAKAENRLKQVLCDYLSGGMPVVAAATLSKLPEHGAFGEGIREAIRSHASSTASIPDLGPSPGRDHAILVLGHHMTRPCEFRDNPGPPYGASADAFVISDLALTPFLKVDASNLSRALLRPMEGRGDRSGQEYRLAEFLVLLPRGVELSQSAARRLTADFMDLMRRTPECKDLPALDDVGRVGIRAALFDVDRAMRRFDSVIKAPHDESEYEGSDLETWHRYCDWLRTTGSRDISRADDMPALTRSGQGSRPAAGPHGCLHSPGYVWQVEIHRLDRDPPAGSGALWTPPQPAFTLHWRAEEPLDEPGRPGAIGPARLPTLFADHSTRRLLLYFLPTAANFDAATFPVQLAWKEGAWPRHV